LSHSDTGGRGSRNAEADIAHWFSFLTAVALLMFSSREQTECVAAGPRCAQGPRTQKGVRVLSNPQQVQKIAWLINALVDMEYWTEEEEQMIFEHAVQMVRCYLMSVYRHLTNHKVKSLLLPVLFKMTVEPSFEKD